MSADYRCKAGGGFFAAGKEFERALEALGDGAFKVYAWVCLHADRASGRVAFERAGLARRLGKSRSSLGRHLRELVRAGVVSHNDSLNRHDLESDCLVADRVGKRVNLVRRAVS